MKTTIVTYAALALRAAAAWAVRQADRLDPPPVTPAANGGAGPLPPAKK